MKNRKINGNNRQGSCLETRKQIIDAFCRPSLLQIRTIATSKRPVHQISILQKAASTASNRPAETNPLLEIERRLTTPDASGTVPKSFYSIRQAKEDVKLAPFQLVPYFLRIASGKYRVMAPKGEPTRVDFICGGELHGVFCSQDRVLSISTIFDRSTDHHLCL